MKNEHTNTHTEKKKLEKHIDNVLKENRFK